MTEVVVNKIVALAKAGEHDADRLAEHVLNDLIDDGLPPPPSITVAFLLLSARAERLPGELYARVTMR
jgi:hypothetical protein